MGSNLDLRHINYLNTNKHILDLKDFYFSLNCIVQYKGLRVHAQVITPGVIFNSEHLVEYGEAEEGIIKFNQDFHDSYKIFCEKLNIRELKVIDKNEKEYIIFGNPEIKGVRGIDKRKYLFDLNHLFPRDYNYMGVDDTGCLLRPELIREYQMKIISQKINTEYAEEMKKINTEIETASKNIKDPNAYLAIFEEKMKRKEEIFEKVTNEVKPELILDTTLFTDTKLKFENPYKEKDEAFLINLAKFLKEESIEKFLNEVGKEDNVPSDCFSLTEYLHKIGINCRYYGEIMNKIEKMSEVNSSFSPTPSPQNKNFSWIKSLILRDLIRRSAKHIFNDTMRELPEYLVKEYTAYFLNILLSPSILINSLEGQNIEYINGFIQSNKQLSNLNQTHENKNQANIINQENKASNSDKNKKKKNKNKKKKNKGENETEYDSKIQLYISENLINKELCCLLEPEKSDIEKFFIKPSTFWGLIQSIIKKRYNFDFKINENFDNIENSINKFGLLRDFCLTVGIQIEAFDYELYYDYSNKNDFKYTNMPFKSNNIINFFITCKDFSLPSEVHKPLFDQAEGMFKTGNLAESAEKYKQTIYLCNEVYGPINHYSAVSHKKLGEISYIEGDIMNSIRLIQKSIIISEKLYNFDSSFVANSYAELSTYFHLIGQDSQAFKYILKSLEIIHFTYPKNVN